MTRYHVSFYRCVHRWFVRCRHWLSNAMDRGTVGLLITPVFYLNNSSSIIFTIVISLLCGFIGLASALAGSMLLSGLRGKATKTGPTYINGFGAHHLGGLILSSEERKGLVNPKREMVVSY